MLKCLCKRNLYFKSPEIVCKAGKLLILFRLAKFLRIRHFGFLFLNLSCCRFIAYRRGLRSLLRGVAISTCMCLIPHWHLNARGGSWSGVRRQLLTCSWCLNARTELSLSVQRQLLTCFWRMNAGTKLPLGVQRQILAHFWR